MSSKSAPVGRSFTSVLGTCPKPPSRWDPPVEHQHRVPDPRSGPAGDLDAADRHVEIVLGRVALEAGALDPDPALGVLGSPVVADHPAPPVHLDSIAAHLEHAVEDRVRVRAEELGLRELRAVEEVPRQVVEGLVAVLEAQVPAGLEDVGGDAAGRVAIGQARLRDPDVGVWAGAELVGAELALRRPRPRRRGIEENEPEGAGRVLAGALVDGVADPGTPAAAGLDQLQVEALVVPGLLRHVGKASLGPHGRDAIR